MPEIFYIDLTQLIENESNDGQSFLLNKAKMNKGIAENDAFVLFYV